jgi:hypothetical protein
MRGAHMKSALGRNGLLYTWAEWADGVVGGWGVGGGWGGGGACQAR